MTPDLSTSRSTLARRNCALYTCTTFLGPPPPTSAAVRASQVAPRDQHRRCVIVLHRNAFQHSNAAKHFDVTGTRHFFLRAVHRRISETQIPQRSVDHRSTLVIACGPGPVSVTHCLWPWPGQRYSLPVALARHHQPQERLTNWRRQALSQAPLRHHVMLTISSGLTHNHPDNSTQRTYTRRVRIPGRSSTNAAGTILKKISVGIHTRISNLLTMIVRRLELEQSSIIIDD